MRSSGPELGKARRRRPRLGLTTLYNGHWLIIIRAAVAAFWLLAAVITAIAAATANPNANGPYAYCTLVEFLL